MIPQLLLEEINLGEKNAQDYYDKYGKEELEKALADLRKSDEEILKAYPIKEMSLKFEERTSVKETNNVFKFRSLRVWAMAAAAVLTIAFCVPFMYNGIKEKQNTFETRVKGGESVHSQLRLYKKAGSEILRLASGDKAQENDVIQITYIPGNKNFGVIFSFDGNGNITRHFPDDSWTAGKLEKTGEEVPLSFSYALDAAPEYECFIFVASGEEFSLDKIEKAANGKNAIRYDQLKSGKYFPKGAEASVFILEK
ncbi:hypothetical protein [Treponema sp.]|uniref:hypothetical protein n=1 Tax=Treponema sp. TaxID=166 RepID=UPI00388FC127